MGEANELIRALTCGASALFLKALLNGEPFRRMNAAKGNATGEFSSGYFMRVDSSFDLLDSSVTSQGHRTQCLSNSVYIGSLKSTVWMKWSEETLRPLNHKSLSLQNKNENKMIMLPTITHVQSTLVSGNAFERHDYMD